MKNSISLLLICLLLSFGAAWAEETKVRIDEGNRGLVGVLNVPRSTKLPPVVLILPGFTNDKDGFALGTDSKFFAYLAERLSLQGIASLRLDFHGSGESDGHWEETTFKGQIHDAVLAFDFLKAMTTVDGSKVGVLGYSQGGLVAAHVGAARPDAASLVLWAPVTDPVSTYSVIMGTGKVEEGMAASENASITAPLIWGGQTTLNGAFFKELPLVSTIGAVAQYPGALAVFVARRDTLVRPQPASGQILLDYHNGREELITIDSDHFWNVGTTAATIEDQLVPETVDWFSTSLFR